MIIIKKYIKYIKADCIFLLFESILAFLMGLLNLIGFSFSLSFIITFIINLIIFLIFGYINGKTTNKKGIIEGLISSLTLIIPMFIITLIFYIKDLSIMTLIYYLILMVCSIIGSTIGKNKKEDSSIQNKN